MKEKTKKKILREITKSWDVTKNYMPKEEKLQKEDFTLFPIYVITLSICNFRLDYMKIEYLLIFVV